MAHDSTPTRNLEPDRSSPRAEPRGTDVTGAQYDLGTATLSVDPQALRAPGRDETEAVLASLYEERRRLTRARRLGESSPNEEEYFAELNQYIDRWEAFEAKPSPSDVDVWRKIEALGASLLAVQAKVERHQR